MSNDKKSSRKPKLKIEETTGPLKRGPLTKEDVKPVKTFEEGIQRILEKFNFPAETSRQIFSRLAEYTSAQKAQKTKEKDIKNDED
jgi:hypothetical protein